MFKPKRTDIKDVIQNTHFTAELAEKLKQGVLDDLIEPK